MGLGIDPTNDYVFRLAFGDPANSDLLIHLLNAIPEVPYQKMIGILEMISKTPNQRHIHDSLQRAARDQAWKLKAVELEIQAARREGIATGREEGREEGVLIGQIRLLEQLLNDRPTADHSLSSLTLPELHERVSILKDRLSRGGNS